MRRSLRRRRYKIKKLIGIRYDKVYGSVANADFHIYITPGSFDAEYWPENEKNDELHLLLKEII